MDSDDSPSLHEVALSVVESGTPPDQPQKLTRRNRFVLLDFEIFGDYATTWFVRRGHSGEPVDETFNFKRVDGTWTATGGGGGAPGADLERRPTLLELAAESEMRASWPSRFPDFSGRCDFARYDGANYGPKAPVAFRMQLAVEVAELRFSDRPGRRVAEHGYATVLFDPKRPPLMSAFGTDGSLIGEVGFLRRPRLPWRR